MKKGLFVALVLVLVAAFAASAIYLAAYFTDSAKRQAEDDERANRVTELMQEYNENTSPTQAAAVDPTPTETAFNPYGTPGVSGYEDEYYTPDVIEEPENVPQRPDLKSGNDPVSYTHLTLPTKA